MSQTTNLNILYPTQKASLGGTPSQSAYQQMQLNNAKQNNLNSSFKGGKYKIKKGKGGGYEAPQMVVPYTTNGTNPNDLIAGNTQLSVQGAKNAEFDALSSQKGGNNNWNWGCYSGGKHKKTTHRKKSNKKNKHKNKTNKKINKQKIKHRKTNRKH